MSPTHDATHEFDSVADVVSFANSLLFYSAFKMKTTASTPLLRTSLIFDDLISQIGISLNFN